MCVLLFVNLPDLTFDQYETVVGSIGKEHSETQQVSGNLYSPVNRLQCQKQCESLQFKLIDSLTHFRTEHDIHNSVKQLTWPAAATRIWELKVITTTFTPPSNILVRVPPQKMFVSPSSTIMTDKIITRYSRPARSAKSSSPMRQM